MNNPLRPLLQAGATGAVPGLPMRAWDGIRRWLQGRRPVQAPASGLVVRVRRIVDETADIKSFDLVRTDGAALPEWSAGAHIDVRIDGETVRQYSLCGAPGERDAYRIAVKKAPDSRGGSRAMHCSVRVGDKLVIGAPRNHFPLVDDAAHHVLMAAGIGITPLLAMAQALQARGASYELHYFSRSIAATAFRDLLSTEPYAGRVSLHHAVGERLHEVLQRLLHPCPAGHHLYMCGPRRFTQVIDAVTAGTWPHESLHVEHFAADPAAQAGSSAAFEVRLARSKRTIPVAAGLSIADALGAHGIDVATSCRQGVCGTCLTGVIAGTPDHRDAFLSDRERRAGDRMMICVSRAKSGPLVLDL